MTAVVDLFMGLWLLGGLLFTCVVLGLLVWLECKRPLSEEEIASARADAWEGFDRAREHWEQRTPVRGRH